MHITARLPILIGAGLLSAAIGAGPAQAAGATPQGPQPPHGQGDLIGYFQNRSDCEWVGRLGDMQNRWDQYDCNSVDYGQFRDMYELTADSYNAHDNGGPGNHYPGDHHSGDHHSGGGPHGPHH
ncbi:hypothetical protein [Actinoplanes sp. NPDC051411]|uniref:hypothetical protein n=1 Tax=Actinoplanes sp. NPDC051411 TaxID=3155522 RepID=UPI00344A4C56